MGKAGKTFSIGFLAGIMLVCAGLLAGLGTIRVSAADEQGHRSTVSDERIFERAREYGFVPEELWEDPDKVVTMAEFCRILTNVVAPCGEEKLAKWEELSEAAAVSDETVQMDDALLAIYEAAVALDIQMDQGMGFLREPDWASQSTAQNWWEGASMDYPAFPNWRETILDLNGNEEDMLLQSALYAQTHWSRVDQSYIFPPEDDWTYDFARDITRKEAIRAITVFAESDTLILDHDAQYIRLADVGTYNTEIITDELLRRAADLPPADQAHLPASWCGAGLSKRKDAEHAYVDFRQSDIQILADNGLNFTRVFFDFTKLQYPFLTQERDEVNRRELEELDQLIAWGLEYGVHIQLGCFGAMGYKCQGEKEFDRLSEDEWTLFRAYWEMLGRRYAGIPSSCLSFDLLNEWTPSSRDQFDHYADIFGEITQAIRSADPDRVVLYSLQGNPDLAWAEALASRGIALGIHPYNPVQIVSRMARDSYLSEAVWPMPWFGSVLGPNEELTVAGDISGGTLKIFFEGAVQDALLSVYTDGELYETIDPVSGTIDEYGDYREFTEPYEIAVPEGTEKLTLRSSEESRWIRFNGLQFEKDGITSGIMPQDYLYLTDSAAVNLYVDETGWKNADGLLYDAQSLYASAIEPIRSIAERYHVGVMVNELGVYGDEDIGETACLYLDDLLRILAEQDVGWCYCEMGYFFDFIGGDSFVMQDSPVSHVTYQYDDREESYWMCEKMADILRQ